MTSESERLGTISRWEDLYMTTCSELQHPSPARLAQTGTCRELHITFCYGPYYRGGGNFELCIKLAIQT